MKEPKYNNGDKVKQGIISKVKLVQGLYFYIIKISDGWYTDPEDGSYRYSSNRIKYSELIPEEEIEAEI